MLYPVHSLLSLRERPLTEPESLRVPKFARKIVYHFSYEIITFLIRR